jgi:undecaprenyl-diphosphatase
MSNDVANAVTGKTIIDEISAVDRAVYAAIADVPTPIIDAPIRRLSDAANYSRLWLGVAAVLAALGGGRGRRAAVSGLVAIGITSAVTNLGIKPVADRKRPDRAGEEVPETRHVHMPGSTSFPSGHSASAFAFATAAGAETPALDAPLLFLAGGVAYSRVHTGVHYPGDAIIGSLIGASIGGVVSGAGRWLRGRAESADGCR